LLYGKKDESLIREAISQMDEFIESLAALTAPAESQAVGEREPSMDELSQGTFECDICGLGIPHQHNPQSVEIERLVRPAFEKTKVPANAFGRIGKLPYSSGRTEQLWQHFISGWFASKTVYATTADSTPPSSAQSGLRQKACIGYPSCDGDLEGEPHSKECPLAQPSTPGSDK
jgi:hypothetical protein